MLSLRLEPSMATSNDCFDLQTISISPLNPDLGGPIVGLANICINSILPFLILWAPVLHSAPRSRHRGISSDPESQHVTKPTLENINSESYSPSFPPPPVFTTTNLTLNTSNTRTPIPEVKNYEDSSGVVTALFLLYSQAVPVLVATLLSIKSGSLTLFDAHYAITVTSSPTAVVVSLCCVRYVFRTLRGRSNMDIAIFESIPANTPEEKVIVIVIVVLGISLLVLWTVISCLTTFYSSAYINSEACKGTSFSSFLSFLIISGFAGFLDVFGFRDATDDIIHRGGLGLFSVFWMWVVSFYLVRDRKTITRRWRELNAILNYGWIKKYFWSIPQVCWKIMYERHCFVVAILLFVCLHWSWTLGVINTIKHSFARSQLSYGQILSIVVPIPAFVLFIRGFLANWTKIKQLLSGAGGNFKAGISFIVYGNEMEFTQESTHETNHVVNGGNVLGLNDGSGGRFNSLRTILAIAIIFGLNVGLGIWIWFWVRAGTLPNEPSLLARPHSKWKPISIMLFITGYLVSVMNVFVFVLSLEKYQKSFLSASDEDQKTRRRRHSFGIAIVFFIGFIFSASPVFSPFFALPLSQRHVWIHGCNSYPTEILLTYVDPNLSTLTFYERPNNAALSSQRIPTEVYEYTKNGDLRVVQLRRPAASNATLLSRGDPQLIKTLVVNLDNKTFAGCRSTTPFEEATSDNATQPELSIIPNCTDGFQGNYKEQNYLSFDITEFTNTTYSSSSTIRTRLESPQFNFTGIDAPFFSLWYADEDGDVARASGVILKSVVTKPGNHNTLKSCGMGSAGGPMGVEILSALVVLMEPFDCYAEFMNRPKVYPQF